jgi:xylan 1,4-beta-xylosidase
MGPYTVVTPDEPLTSFASNDMTLFKDTNNKIYAFFNNGWADTLHIYVAELDTVKYRLKETPHQLLTQEPGTWDEAGIEGSHVVKKDGIYYLFYSSWTRGYAVGYATAKNIYGPWKKSPDNPLFGSFSRNDSTFVIRSGKVHYEPKCELLAIGHNQIFIGPDGNYWTSYHGNKKGFPEAVTLIDPIEFKNGKIYTPTPTYTPQKTTYTAKSVLKNKKKIGVE